MLELDRIQVCYGAATALWDVSIRIGAGELVCVVGPNGAGKTTLIDAIAGLNRITAGTLSIDGRSLNRLPRHQFCDQGIALVPEGRRLFTTMSVRENLELGSYRSAARAHRQQSLERVLAIFPALKTRLEAPAGALSGGQQQMVAVARTLLGNPDVVLLDEPAEGLAPVIVQELATQLLALRKEGLSMIISEQNLSFARSLADTAYVLESGYVRYSGTLDHLEANAGEWTRYIAF